MKKSILTVIIICTFFVSSLTSGVSSEPLPPSSPDKIIVVIETKILDFDPQSGMKSRQTVAVSFSDKEITSTFKTGTTNFFGIILNSVRNKFKVESKNFLSNNLVKFNVSGETASGVGIVPNINYHFDILLDKKGHLEIQGCHDGYPAYQIIVNGNIKYSFKHESKEILNLFGECDIKLKP